MSAEQPESGKRKLKSANTPFLVQKKYLAHKETLKAKSPTTDSEPAVISFVSAFKWLLIAVLANLVLSRMITESWFWTYQGKWVNLRNYVPQRGRTARYYTESELSQYDGTDPEKPILLGLDGHVYDVSAGRRIYGPGGTYHHFAGRDGARAFVTGCFQTHLTHDLRGLDRKQMEMLGGWKQFYAEHGRYFRVGTVLHQPIESDVPIPEPCNAKDEGGG